LLNWGTYFLEYLANPRKLFSFFGVLGVGKFLIDSILRAFGFDSELRDFVPEEGYFLSQKFALIGL